MTCDTGHWLSGESNPYPASLEDFIFFWLSLSPFPEFSVVDGRRPSDPKDSAKAGVDEYLDLLQCRALVLHVSVPHSRTDFAVVLKILILMLMVRLGEAQNVLHLEEGCSRALALIMLTFPLASVPPCLSTMLPR